VEEGKKGERKGRRERRIWLGPFMCSGEEKRSTKKKSLFKRGGCPFFRGREERKKKKSCHLTFLKGKQGKKREGVPPKRKREKKKGKRGCAISFFIGDYGEKKRGRGSPCKRRNAETPALRQHLRLKEKKRGGEKREEVVMIQIVGRKKERKGGEEKNGIFKGRGNAILKHFRGC